MNNQDTQTPTASEGAGAAAARTSSRRSWLMAGVATAAVVSGAAFSWLRFSSERIQVRSTNFWQQDLETPDGGRIITEQLRGRPLLVNFWATWCPPCIEELPLLSRFYTEKQANGWQMLGLAVDQLEPVQQFLGRRPVSFPVAMIGTGGMDMSKDLGNSAGGLPFTVVFDAQSELIQRKIGQLTEADLQAWMS